MARKGKLPITIPDGVEVSSANSQVMVKGPKGDLKIEIRSDFSLDISEGQAVVQNNSTMRDASAMYGLYRTLIANMVEGVSQGFVKKLQLVGVGYRAQKKGNDLELSVGYSHPVIVMPLEGVTLDVDGQDTIVISGADKCAVGDMAANIIKIRDARRDPYKNKGIRYFGAQLRKKSGKKVA